MARRSADEAAPIKLVSARDLKALAETCDGYKRKADTAQGNMRELIGEYVEKKNLHKQAFSTIQRLRRMEPGELWLWKAHFDDYWHKLGLEKIANTQGQLVSAGTEEDEVTPRGPRLVEEEAGAA
jgi:hypothetical protein